MCQNPPIKKGCTESTSLFLISLGYILFLHRRRVSCIQTIQNLTSDVVDTVCIEQIIKTRIADNHAVTFCLIVLLQESIDRITQLQAVLFILTHQLRLQLVAQILQILLQFGNAVVFLLRSLLRKISVVLVLCLEFLVSASPARWLSGSGSGGHSLLSSP